MSDESAASTLVKKSPKVEVEIATGPSSAAVQAPAPDKQLVESDLLVEDVSIDGMCGVY